VQRVDFQRAAVREADEARRHGRHRPLVDRDVSHVLRRLAVRQHDEVARPRAQQRHAVRGAGPPEDRDPLVAVLPAVAVGAHEGAVAPQLREARHVRHAVAHAAGDQDAPGGDRVAALERGAERAPGLDTGHDTLAELDRRQLRQLLPAGCVELGRARAVLAEQAADRGRAAVAGLARVDDERARSRSTARPRLPRAIAS
jgi:hypothetical protein